MKRILIDTNFLFIPFQWRVDIFREFDKLMDEPYELCILEDTLKELDRIQERERGHEKEQAKLAKKLLSMRPVTTIDPQKSLYTSDNSKSCTAVDDKIVAVADAGTYVATQDRLLRQKLKKKGIRTIVLREKQYLELI